MAEDDENVGFEQGLSWLPTNVLDDKYRRQQPPPPPPHHLKSSAKEPLLPLPSKYNLKALDQRPRYPSNWAAGGPGMQAVFLDSGKKSCGTGVFLPRGAGTDANLTNKPAYSPVLLPWRVVQTLRLNVHELGLQIKPRDVNKTSKCLDRNTVGKKKSSNVSTQKCVISQNRSSSPDIFLPKEWTY